MDHTELHFFDPPHLAATGLCYGLEKRIEMGLEQYSGKAVSYTHVATKLIRGTASGKS